MVDEDSEVIVEPYACSIEVYCPQRPSTHTIVEIREEEIVVITGHVKPNLNSEAMINDFNKRKQPRFRCVTRLSKAEAATITPPPLICTCQYNFSCTVLNTVCVL